MAGRNVGDQLTPRTIDATRKMKVKVGRPKGGLFSNQDTPNMGGVSRNNRGKT